MPASGHDGDENSDQIRENLGSRKDTMQKKAERDYHKNVTEV
jgi:hypothetical protein